MTNPTDPRIEAAARAIADAMLRHGDAPGACALAKSALKAADAAAWRPIESAPKNVPPTLVIDASMPEEGPYIANCKNGIWCDDYDMVEPTHWMPLPPAPVMGGRDE